MSKIKELEASQNDVGEALKLKHFPNVEPADNYKSLRKQFSALLTMLGTNKEICSHYMDKDYKLSEKRLDALEVSLESERAMNAQLTLEIETTSAAKDAAIRDLGKENERMRNALETISTISRREQNSLIQGHTERLAATMGGIAFEGLNDLEELERLEDERDLKKHKDVIKGVE